MNSGSTSICDPEIRYAWISRSTSTCPSRDGAGGMLFTSNRYGPDPILNLSSAGPLGSVSMSPEFPAIASGECSSNNVFPLQCADPSWVGKTLLELIE
jgi:hypothetical protein